MGSLLKAVIILVLMYYIFQAHEKSENNKMIEKLMNSNLEYNSDKYNDIKSLIEKNMNIKQNKF